MDDKIISKLSILIAFIGLLLLIILSQGIDKNDYLDYVISENNDLVTINGEVKSINLHEDIIFMKIGVCNEIDVVAFNQVKLNDDNLDGALGEFVTVKGKVSISNLYGKNIIADRIELKN